MKHNIFIIPDKIDIPDTYILKTKEAVTETLNIEQIDITCNINVLMTNDEGIREYNRMYRGIDKPTDVLSFPMQDFTCPGTEGLINAEFDEDTGELLLGDVVISMESVKRQAIEYKNSVDHELTYMTVHSVLHLMGYDHDNTENEKLMHGKTEDVLKMMGYKMK